MTWVEFKRFLEENGVQDKDEINYIDYGGSNIELYFNDSSFHVDSSSSSKNYVEPRGWKPK